MLKQKSASPHSIFLDINPTGTGSAPWVEMQRLKVWTFREA
jgi:hypothetical protein